MATYRQVYGDFWNDSKVVNKFTPEDRYFFLYLLTNSHTNICGCYEISYRQMAWETGYNEETIKKLMKRMEFELDVIRYSDKTNEVLILKWHKYNWNSSPKVVKSLQTVSEYIKDEEFKKYIVNLLEGETIPYPYHIRHSGYGMDTSVSVSVSVSDSVSASDIKKIPPKKEDNCKVGCRECNAINIEQPEVLRKYAELLGEDTVARLNELKSQKISTPELEELYKSYREKLSSLLSSR